MTPDALSVSFLFYALLLAGLVAAGLRRTLPEHDAKRVITILVTWLGFAAVAASTGFIERGGARQPRFLVVLVPMLVFLAWLSLSPRVGAWARGLRADVLMAAQTFRVGVEIFLYFMWQAYIVPRVLTFEGRNVDIVVGLTAPVAAWAYRRYPRHRRAIVIGWNVAALGVLLNVIGHGILSAPGPQRYFFNDIPNRAVVLFPYVYLVAVFVPLALSLHVLALRASSSLHRPDTPS